MFHIEIRTFLKEYNIAQKAKCCANCAFSEDIATDENPAHNVAVCMNQTNESEIKNILGVAENGSLSYEQNLAYMRIEPTDICTNHRYSR